MLIVGAYPPTNAWLLFFGVYKLTYCHAWSDSKKGDTGIFEISVKDNKVINILEPDDPNWKKHQLKYFYKIDSKTNELSGYASGIDSSSGDLIRFNINMKGVFINKKFAGEGSVQITSPESLIIEKFIFESFD